MRYWIFQANPTNYALVEELSQGNVDEWQVNQHATEVHNGDQVLLWQSGKEAGVYGLATVTSEPRLAKWSKPRKAVTLRVDKSFVDRPLLKAALIGSAGLESLSILRFSQSTNFPVSDDEWLILMQLLDSTPQRLMDGAMEFPGDEAQLRAALARHLDQLEDGLHPYFPERVEEYPTGYGRIDLLCRDEGGYAVVVELKRRNWSIDKAIGQIAGYMGWARKELTDAAGVRGILAVPNEGELASRLTHAASAVQGLEIKRYSVRLTFE